MSIRQGNNLIAGTPDLSGKADTDLSNLDATGKSYGAELSMPSDNYIDLTLQASGSFYTAPANGYFVSWSNDWVIIESYDVFGMSFFSNAQSGVSGGRGYLPVKKGTQVKVFYSSIQSLRFYYAEGEI